MTPSVAPDRAPRVTPDESSKRKQSASPEPPEYQPGGDDIEEQVFDAVAAPPSTLTIEAT